MTTAIAGIDRSRIDAVLTRRLLSIVFLPRVLGLPTAWAISVAIYGQQAPLWMYIGPGLLYLVSLASCWWLQSRYTRDPESLTPARWRWLYGLFSVPTPISIGLMGAAFATLPGEQEHILWAFVLCMVVGWVPVRAINGPI
ncbi:MAG TPA: hypothetical protein VMI56_21685, partial [Reyranella sp.]|nr:hypothetical protein [Reyranella sp.]